MRASLSRTRAVRSILLSSVIIAAGCGSSTSAPTETSPPAETSPSDTSPSDTEETSSAPEAEATPGTSLSACELVAPADIEAVLGLDSGSVAEGELKETPTTLDAADNQCRYKGQDWGGIVVSVTPTDGVGTFNRVVKVYGDTGEKLDVADGSYWFEGEDRAYFLKGSVMVILQFTSIAGGGGFRDPSIELGRAVIAKI